MRQVNMADFLLTTAVTGGNQAAALSIMGSGAAADTTIAAKDRGLEDWQAFTLGTIAGLAEVATEKVSLDALLNADLLKDGALRYIWKNALAEGSEEVASSTINLMADIFISKDQSEWQKSIDAYITEEGLEPNQAFARAMADQALSLGVDFLGGFISGGVLGGGGAVVNEISTHNMGKELGKLDLDKDDIQAFIDTGLESDPETAAYRMATEMQKKIEAGETPSNYALARLYRANTQVQPDTAWDNTTDPVEDTGTGRIQAEEYSRLLRQAMAENGRAADSAEAADEALRRAEDDSAPNRLQVGNERNPANIRSGGDTTDWAEELGTNRIDVEAYSRLLRQAMAGDSKAEGSGERQNGYTKMWTEPGERDRKAINADGTPRIIYHGTSDAWDTYQKKGENLSSDRKQFEEFKAILGENAPKTFAEFQNLKYNDTEKWEFLKLDYTRRNKLIKHPEMALPGAETARIPDGKIIRYLFNPENKDGWAKGQAFTSRLGYSAENWKSLQSEIQRGAKRYIAVLKVSDEYGQRYEQRMVLYGRSGRPANVIVGWIQRPNGSTTMTTAYIKEVTS